MDGWGVAAKANIGTQVGVTERPHLRKVKEVRGREQEACACLERDQAPGTASAKVLRQVCARQV